MVKNTPKKIKDIWFARQKPINNFIVDCYAPSAKLVIEIDRGQHFEEANMQKDIRRDTHLEILGLKVLRFNNFQVLQSIDAVLDLIYDEIPSS